jgi:hypothetical protein
MKTRKHYETVCGSDCRAGGMFLELWDLTTNQLALWAFYSDNDRAISFESYGEDVPKDVVDWFHEEARWCLPRLPPTTDAGTSNRRPNAKQ